MQCGVKLETALSKVSKVHTVCHQGQRDNSSLLVLIQKSSKAGVYSCIIQLHTSDQGSFESQKLIPWTSCWSFRCYCPHYTNDPFLWPTLSSAFLLFCENKLFVLFKSHYSEMETTAPLHLYLLWASVGLWEGWFWLGLLMLALPFQHEGFVWFSSC